MYGCKPLTFLFLNLRNIYFQLAFKENLVLNIIYYHLIRYGFQNLNCCNLAHFWNTIFGTNHDEEMKKTINVLVVEDNEYYNNLIFNALQQSIHFIQQEAKYQLVLHSFIDSLECIRKIESRVFIDNEVIAFVDYNMGNGITGAQIIRLLKKENSNTTAILLSQSKNIEEKSSRDYHDYFVIKDTFAPALCRLYLDQYIENKF
jgi:CheY-like chemotaxis protein